MAKNETYEEFVEKFKPKKNTDDCYTPANIYEAVLAWVVKEYGIDPGNVVRPFWPGGDYENYDYPEGCVVVDNPPFSIITKICRNYCRRGIKFFLFAPYLTNLGIGYDLDTVTHVITETDITYENGARVATSFVTNMSPELCAVSAPDLGKTLGEIDRENRLKGKNKPPQYKYPDAVLTSTMLGYMAVHGVPFKVLRKDCTFIRQLDAQKEAGKKAGIFGGGYLLSEKAAIAKAVAEKAAIAKAVAEKAAIAKAVAEKADAICWELSEKEREIVRTLGAQDTEKASA